MFRLTEGTGVFTPGGRQVGVVHRFVLGPATREVTHIVVHNTGGLSEDKVLPIGMLLSATDERIVFNGDLDDFSQLPPFEVKHYLGARDYENHERVHSPAGYADDYYYFYPAPGCVGYPAYGLGLYAWPPLETVRTIPKVTIPLKKGMNVISSDDEHAGKIDLLFFEAGSDKVSHFVASDGLLREERKLIPARWVESTEADSVQLTVSFRFLKCLSGYEFGKAPEAIKTSARSKARARSCNAVREIR